jgi:polyribonucleotide nucleotidyltransferase
MQIGTKKTFDLGDGRIIEIETGKLAKQADGAVVVKMGQTMLLATVVAAQEAKPGVDFMPLSVDYMEKYAAAGKFPGGFFKREARPSEYEILISRLIDRALRPLFPDDYHADTQVIVSLISSDKDTLPDALACFAASAALSVSDIPFNGPVSEVRVGRINGKFVINPGKSELPASDIDMMVAGSLENIVMVEGEMKEISETDMVEAIKFAHEAIKVQCQVQLDLAEAVGKKSVVREYSHETNDEELRERVNKETADKFFEVAAKGIASKNTRKELFKAVEDAFLATLTEEELAEKGALAKKYLHDAQNQACRRAVLETRVRLDGRKTNEIRPIWSEIDYLPAAHGSAIFTRGETQSLTTVTLGTKLDEQMIDGVIYEGTNKFLLHYNFPPFSTGEAKFLRGLGRREVGHGNLAMRAIKNMMPETPYTIRVVSDILESNGSSSMATVCAGTLALMDAGVQIKQPVSGIAMGLITDDSGKYAVLSDILGDEDHLGDMDFKVCGTKNGVTATQMDLKINGLSYQVLLEALNQAKEGRLHILNKLLETIHTPRADYKPHAPRIESFKIDKEYIGAVIGPGGKVIQEIQRETGTTITIEEEGNLGIVSIAAENKESIDKATRWVKGIVAVPEEGQIYDGKVKSIMPFGAFVEFMPGKQGLLHISEVSWSRLETLDGVLKEDDLIKVKLLEVDKKTGKFRLSRKVLMPRPEKPAAPQN